MKNTLLIGMLGLAGCATAPYRAVDELADELSQQKPRYTQASLDNGSCALLITAYSDDPEVLYSKDPSIFLGLCTSGNEYRDWVASLPENEWQATRYRFGIGCSCDEDGTMHRAGVKPKSGIVTASDFERRLGEVVEKIK